MKITNRWFRCECGNEILKVQKEIDGNYTIFNFAIHEHSGVSYWSRFKYAISIIFGGKMYNDQIYLERKKANELAEFLSKNIVFEFSFETERRIILRSGRPNHYLYVYEEANEGGYDVHAKYISEEELKIFYEGRDSEGSNGTQ